MSNEKIARQLCRLKIQGMEGVSPETIAEFGGWWRMAFGVCALLAGIGTLFASPLFLWILVPLAFGGAIFAVHPMDLIYNHGIRHWRGTGPLPKRGIPTRFACGIGVVWLIITALLFSSGALMAGYVMGISIFAIAILVSTTDICLPSILYQLISGRSDLVHCVLS